MARRLRIVLPGQPLHVIQRGNNRTRVFQHDRDHHFYLRCCTAARERYRCDIHAYVLMSNHVHFLLTPRRQGDVSGFMQTLGRRYVRYFNDVHGRSGTLWEGRFKSALIDCAHYLWSCYRYIELNPVRAGLVADPAAYRWSSYRCNALGRLDPLVTPHPAYLMSGIDTQARCAYYRNLFEDPLPNDHIGLLRSATLSGAVVGSEEFVRLIETAKVCTRIPLAHGGDRRSRIFQISRGQSA